MNPPDPSRAAARSDAPSSNSSQEEVDARDFADFIADQAPIDAAAASWMVRRHDGLTPEEEAEFQEWLVASPEHGEVLAQIEGVWGRMDELPEGDIDALKAALPHDAPTFAPPNGAAPTPVAAQPSRAYRPQPASPERRSWLLGLGRFAPQAAAAAVAFGAVGGGWYGWNAWQLQPTFDQSFATARGEQKQVKLPDGSTLWLDTGTHAAVTLYRQRREVRLSEGQVLFAVQADPAKPFDVLAGNTRVTVVGTRFSVRRTRSGLGDEGSVHVVVEEGRVRVASNSRARDIVGTRASVELGAGQSITAAPTGELGRLDRIEAAADWRAGRITFNGTPLAQALAEFERYGDTGLVIRDPSVKALKVNGSFDVRHVGAFAKALPQVLPIRLHTQGGRTEIIAAGSGQ